MQFAVAQSHALAAAAAPKYHLERVRGETGTLQPWVAMSINAGFWQSAQPLHWNTGWQAGGVTYPQNIRLYVGGGHIDRNWTFVARVCVLFFRNCASVSWTIETHCWIVDPHCLR